MMYSSLPTSETMSDLMFAAGRTQMYGILVWPKMSVTLPTRLRAPS